MCGRYVLRTNLENLQLRFGLPPGDLEHPERYNIAPTQSVFTIINQGQQGNQVAYMRWGLVPSWTKEKPAGNQLINARADTLAEKPSFGQALERRRCLVPADGFYEWRGTGRNKKPMYVHLASDEPFAMAGLWDAWRTPEGGWLRSCTIITTEPNSLMQPIHHRMPVILRPEQEALWLDPSVQDPATLMGLLKPYSAEAMTAHPVSDLVNSTSNDSPECIEPVEELKLF